MKLRTLALPLIGTLMAFTGNGQTVDISSSGRNGERVTYKNSYGISNFNVESRGKFELTDDDKDIKSMSADGYLEITKTVFGNRRSIVITSEGNGLKREYFEGRTKVSFEPDGRKWLSEILPELVRSTTIGAESRVNRYYRQGGSRAVTEEIARLESDYVKAHYANMLMKLNVPAADFSLIVSQVAETMESDHYLTEFLQKNLNKFMQNKLAAEAVFAATGKMESDHYKTQVIKEALRNSPASLENMKIILQATGNMESDHYKTEVLSVLLQQNNLSDAIIAEMIITSKSIESDFYRASVLNKALDKPGLSAASFEKVLESVKDIESDHYKTEVLSHLLQSNLGPDAQNSLITVLSTFESDHYLTTIGSEMMKKQQLTDDAFQKLLELMGRQGNDYYTASFLQSALQRTNLSKQNLLVILQTTGNIDSDHYVSEVLIQAAPKIKASNDSSLRDAYRTAAKKIESDTYYGRTLKAIE